MIAPRFTVAALRSLLARWRGDAAAPTILTCYGKPDCSLCDKAKVPVGRLVAASGGRIVAEWVDILDDPRLEARWGERIPVVCAGETVLAEGKVSELRLRRALAALPRAGRGGHG
jgi:hypothetical protein